MTDNRPHSRACGIVPHDHGHLCHRNCPTCGEHAVPDSGQAGADAVRDGRVRATIALHALEGSCPSLHDLEWSSPATSGQLADALERIGGDVDELHARLRQAEQELDMYREAIRGGQAFLSLLFPPRFVTGLPPNPDMAGMDRLFTIPATD